MAQLEVALDDNSKRIERVERDRMEDRALLGSHGQKFESLVFK
jgi:hypothetical protein